MAGTKLKQVGREEERFGKDGEAGLYAIHTNKKSTLCNKIIIT